MTQTNDQTPIEWLRILGKGMVTIPKLWRVELGMREGGIVQAEKTNEGILIRPIEKKAPYRVYSRKELLQFVADDQL